MPKPPPELGWTLLNKVADKMADEKRARFIEMVIPAESEFSRGNISRTDYELLLIAGSLAVADVGVKGA